MASNTLFNLHPNELRYSAICLVVCIICWNFQMVIFFFKKKNNNTNDNDNNKN